MIHLGNVFLSQRLVHWICPRHITSQSEYRSFGFSAETWSTEEVEQFITFPIHTFGGQFTRGGRNPTSGLQIRGCPTITVVFEEGWALTVPPGKLNGGKTGLRQAKDIPAHFW